MSRILLQSEPMRLVHIPKFRSTRAVWMYNELKLLYKGTGSCIPPMNITTFSDIPSFRTKKPQWLLEKNPNGKVPTLVHGPIVLFESGAICSYMLDLFDTERRLLPRDPAAVSLYYLMVSWCASTLDNLTATSWPTSIIHIAENKNSSNADPAPTRPRPMDDVVPNRRYFDEIVVPYIAKQLQQAAPQPETKVLGDAASQRVETADYGTSDSGRLFLCGDNLTAADVVVGFHLLMACDKMSPSWLADASAPAATGHHAVLAYLQRLRQRPAFQSAVAPVEEEGQERTNC